MPRTRGATNSVSAAAQKPLTRAQQHRQKRKAQLQSLSTVDDDSDAHAQKRQRKQTTTTTIDDEAFGAFTTPRPPHVCPACGKVLKRGFWTHWTTCETRNEDQRNMTWQLALFIQQREKEARKKAATPPPPPPPQSPQKKPTPKKPELSLVARLEAKDRARKAAAAAAKSAQQSQDNNSVDLLVSNNQSSSSDRATRKSIDTPSPPQALQLAPSVPAQAAAAAAAPELLPIPVPLPPRRQQELSMPSVPRLLPTAMLPVIAPSRVALVVQDQLSSSSSSSSSSSRKPKPKRKSKTGWTPELEQKLVRLVEKHGRAWVAIFALRGPWPAGCDNNKLKDKHRGIIQRGKEQQKGQARRPRKNWTKKDTNQLRTEMARLESLGVTGAAAFQRLWQEREWGEGRDKWQDLQSKHRNLVKQEQLSKRRWSVHCSQGVEPDVTFEATNNYPKGAAQKGASRGYQRIEVHEVDDETKVHVFRGSRTAEPTPDITRFETTDSETIWVAHTEKICMERRVPPSAAAIADASAVPQAEPVHAQPIMMAIIAQLPSAEDSDAGQESD